MVSAGETIHNSRKSKQIRIADQTFSVLFFPKNTLAAHVPDRMAVMPAVMLSAMYGFSGRNGIVIMKMTEFSGKPQRSMCNLLIVSRM